MNKPEQTTMFLDKYWETVTQEQWKQLLAIPEARDFKEGFEYISGIKILDNIETIKIGNKVYNKAEIEKKLKDIKPIN